jgi:hypothetical protein
MMFSASPVGSELDADEQDVAQGGGSVPGLARLSDGTRPVEVA